MQEAKSSVVLLSTQAPGGLFVALFMAGQRMEADAVKTLNFMQRPYQFIDMIRISKSYRSNRPLSFSNPESPAYS